jgi:hypothetical protein
MPHRKQTGKYILYKFPRTSAVTEGIFCKSTDCTYVFARNFIKQPLVHCRVSNMGPVHKENLKHPRVIPLTCGWISRGNLIAVLSAVPPLSRAAQFPWRPASCLSLCACVCASSFVNNGPFVYYMSYFNKPAPCVCPPARSPTHPTPLKSLLRFRFQPIPSASRLISLSSAHLSSRLIGHFCCRLCFCQVRLASGSASSNFKPAR